MTSNPEKRRIDLIEYSSPNKKMKANDIEKHSATESNNHDGSKPVDVYSMTEHNHLDPLVSVKKEIESDIEDDSDCDEDDYVEDDSGMDWFEREEQNAKWVTKNENGPEFHNQIKKELHVDGEINENNSRNEISMNYQGINETSNDEDIVTDSEDTDSGDDVDNSDDDDDNSDDDNSDDKK